VQLSDIFTQICDNAAHTPTSLRKLKFSGNACADFMEPILLCYSLNNYIYSIEHNVSLF